MNKKLELWQNRLSEAKTAYSAERSMMDRRDAYYNGTRIPSADPNTGRTPTKKATNVRNIIYELIESQIDSTVPMPRVEAVHQEDDALARLVESLLRRELTLKHFSEMNDLQERTVPVQGGSYWHTEWSPNGGWHCTLGDLEITERHPKQIIPQPGIYDLGDMDYVIVQVAQTREFIRKRYGKEVEGEEAPEIRGTEYTSCDELVTQNIGYAIGEKGIDMYTWVNDTELEDIEDYQARHLKRCSVCGLPEGECECEHPKFKNTTDNFETLTEDIILYSGEVVPAISMAGEMMMTNPDGLPQTDENGGPIIMPVIERTKIPRYKPDKFPLVLRRNVRKYDSLLGGSDVDVISDQQDAINKLGTKINEKLLKGGSFVTLPEGVPIETNDNELKIIRVKSPAQQSLISVINVQPNIGLDMNTLESNYQWAKSTLGITDSFQGKYDSSATSGKAKQFAANQAAGRLQSKREMKNSAYASLYELMFKFLLAYADEPVPISKQNAGGNTEYAHFNRWDFLRKDEAGEFYWDDEFIFSVDPSATLASNREALWDQISLNYQSGAFGPLDSMESQLLLWTMYAKTNYPHAEEIKQAIAQRIERQEEMQNVMSQMQNGAGTQGMELPLAGQ